MTASCAPTAATTSTQLYQERTHAMPSRRVTGEHHRPAATTAAKKGESTETVVDSGIEELDSRSSSDHHLDSIMALSGARLERGEKGRGGAGSGASDLERGGDFLESYMSYLDGQSFQMQNAAAAAAASTYPKTSRFREERHRQTSTAPASYHAHRRRGEEQQQQQQLLRRRRDEEEEEEEEEDDEEGVATEDGGQDGYGARSRPISPYFDRPRTPEMKPLWGEGPLGGGGGEQQAAALLEGKKVYPPASSMKPSIISELSSKLQHRSRESWSSQRPLSRHR